MRAAANVTLAFLLLFPCSAQADWVRILAGPTQQVVANARYAAVLRQGVVWLVRDDGSLAGRLDGGRREATNPSRAMVQRETEEILDFLDVAEADREEDWALDLLYDERTLDQRRRARTRGAGLAAHRPQRPALAAGAGSIWLADGEALLRIDRHGDVVRVLAHGQRGQQLIATEAGLARRAPDGFHLSSSDHRPEQVLTVPVGAGHAVLSPSGDRWAYTTAEGVFWLSADGDGGRFAPARAVVDLVYCGETLVILLDDVLLAVAAGAHPQVRSRAVMAERIACPQGMSGPWLASGQGLFVSADQGEHWRTIETPPGARIAAVAATAHHLWLATDRGLFFSSPRGELQPRIDEQTGAPIERSRRHGVQTSWLSWLPRISLRATAITAPTGHQLEALAYATIPLEPRRLPLAQMALAQTAAPGTGTAPRPAGEAPDLSEPERRCLALVKRKAVELAMSEPERARSYVHRAGRAAWLPELRLLVSRRYGRSESLDVATSSTALSSPLGIDTVNDIRYEARATWDLARLVFSAEELAAQNQAMHMAESRRDIENTVNRLYFERRRLALELAGTDSSSARLRSLEIAAELDALTGGASGTCAGDSNHGGR